MFYLIQRLPLVSLVTNLFGLIAAMVQTASAILRAVFCNT